MDEIPPPVDNQNYDNANGEKPEMARLTEELIENGFTEITDGLPVSNVNELFELLFRLQDKKIQRLPVIGVEDDGRVRTFILIKGQKQIHAQLWENMGYEDQKKVVYTTALHGELRDPGKTASGFVVKLENPSGNFSDIGHTEISIPSYYVTFETGSDAVGMGKLFGYEVLGGKDFGQDGKEIMRNLFEDIGGQVIES